VAVNGFGINTNTAPALNTAGGFGGVPTVTPKPVAPAPPPTEYNSLLKAGDYAGAFAAAQQAGQLNEMLSNAPDVLTAANPKGMSQQQFEQYYAAFSPYEQSLAGQTIAQGEASGGSADERWNPQQLTAAQVKNVADLQYAADKLDPNSVNAMSIMGGSTAATGTGGTPGSLAIPNVEAGGFEQEKPDKNLFDEDFNDIGLAAMMIYSGGTLSAGLGGGVVGGAEASAATGATQAALTDQNIGKGALIGALGGAVTGGLGKTVGSLTGTGNIGGAAITGAGVGAVKGALTGQGAGLGAIEGGAAGLIGGLAKSAPVQGEASNLFGNAGGLVTKVGAGLLNNEVGSLVGGSNSSPGSTNMAGISAIGGGAINTQVAPGAANAGGAAVGGSAIDTTLSSMLSGGLQATGALASANAQEHGIESAEGTQTAAQGNINNIWSTQQGTGQLADKNLNNALGNGGAAGNASATSAFEAQPGFASTVAYGNQAAERQAAAMGNAGNIGTAMNIGAYDTNTANQYYQNYVNNLMGAAGLGSTANTALTGANLQTSGNISQLQQNYGVAEGTGYTGTAAALSPLANSAGNLLGNALSGTGNANTSGLGSGNSNTGTGNAGSYGAGAGGVSATSNGDLGNGATGVGNFNNSGYTGFDDPTTYNSTYQDPSSFGAYTGDEPSSYLDMGGG
jgi:hypothetical protein